MAIAHDLNPNAPLLKPLTNDPKRSARLNWQPEGLLENMRFASLFVFSALLLVGATVILMTPLSSAGPMNISFEEPLGTTMIAIGVTALVFAAWKNTEDYWTWASSLLLLGAVLLALIRYSVAHHPPSEGRADPNGLIPPTGYSMAFAYSTSYGVIVVGMGLILIKSRLKMKKTDQT